MSRLDPEAQAAIRRRRWLRVRISLMGLLLFAFASAVVARAFELQVSHAPALKEMAEAQYQRDVHLSPKRGTIYDRHGAELAVSVEVDSLYANPREIRRAGVDPVETADRLLTVVSFDRARIIERLSSDRLFVWVERHITPQQAARVRQLGIVGVHMVKEAKRYYPNRSLAAHVLGFANIDGEGLEGLELELNDRLRGSVQAVPAIRDRRGSVVFSEQLLDDRATQGDDIHLTIDKTIQHITERELELAVRTFEARAGTVVVIDPRSGEILALANYPSYDPNDPSASPAADRRNRAVTDRFEPGSTVKPFTVAAALAKGTVGARQLIDCGSGSMEVAEYTIHDSTPYDELTPAQVLAFSSNIGTARIGSTLGRRGLYRAFRSFGFGAPTGLPLPGETGGILRHYRRWYEMDAATISFGQGVSVTSVQMAFAMGTIANGGRLMDPVLTQRIVSATGEVVAETLPRSRRQVVPRATARLVGDMLTAVTGPGGTGEEAAIEGYLVAGKTGTAQKADYVRGGYTKDQWLASFVGFAPAEDPRLVISVVIDEPLIAYYGGVVAGPVFRRIGAAVLHHLGVPADSGRRVLAAKMDGIRRRAERDQESAARAAEQEAAELGFVHGEVLVADEAASAAAAKERGGRALGESEARVPDLMGKTARASVMAIFGAGLVGSLEGSGRVVGQDPPPGMVVPTGTPVRVFLAPPTFDSLPEPLVEEEPAHAVVIP